MKDLSRNYILSNYNKYIYGSNSYLYHLLQFYEKENNNLKNKHYVYQTIKPLFNIFTQKNPDFKNRKIQHCANECYEIVLDMLRSEIAEGLKFNNNINNNVIESICPINMNFKIRLKKRTFCRDGMLS